MFDFSILQISHGGHLGFLATTGRLEVASQMLIFLCEAYMYLCNFWCLLLYVIFSVQNMQISLLINVRRWLIILFIVS